MIKIVISYIATHTSVAHSGECGWGGRCDCRSAIGNRTSHLIHTHQR